MRKHIGVSAVILTVLTTFYSQAAPDMRDADWESIGKAMEKSGDPVLFERIAREKFERTGYGMLITLAGNAEDDGLRLRYLQRLRFISSLEKKEIPGLTAMISGVEQWVNAKNLNYFHSYLLKNRDFDFGIDARSPMYPIAAIYRARMMVWVTTNSGTDETNRVFLARALNLFRLARAAFPENRVVRMYLGEAYPPTIEYPAVEGAPAWAVFQREAIERLSDIIEWWIDHRMQENGEYGGGWGDDCEMWRSWIPVLLGFDSPKISWAQSYFSKQLLDQPHLRGGYMADRLTDVEHSAEDVSDALTPMMHLDPDNPEWKNRALRLAELMETRWTGKNARGFLQFKSTYFNLNTVDTTRVKACDTVYHPRAAQPALLYWQRTGDRDLGRLFSAWMDAWVDAAARSERGKPAGMLPTAIHWPEGSIGGVGNDWWDPQNHPSKTRLYAFPSAMSMMTKTLLLTYHMTGDEKYLEPIRSMARIRLGYLLNKPEKIVPGSESWSAERIGFLSETLAKHRFLTGKTEFDELLAREQDPYMLFLIRKDREALTRGLRQAAEALRRNFPGYAGEVLYTDRVVRFPSIFRVLEGGPAYPTPNLQLIYSTATGDPGDAQYFPLNAVRWLTPPRDLAALVIEKSRNAFSAELYHFGIKDRPMQAELFLLENGEYSFSLHEENNEKPLAQGMFTVSGPRTRIGFTLAPLKLSVLNVRLRK